MSTRPSYEGLVQIMLRRQDLERLNNKTVHPGQRVILTTNRHGVTHSNPMLGSRYFCKGIIREIDKRKQGLCVRVNWDNGKRNVYYANDLSLVPPEHHLPSELFEL
jgi:hypothetical protein